MENGKGKEERWEQMKKLKEENENFKEKRTEKS